MKTSARNQYWGKVASVKRGAVNAEVLLALEGGETIVASITNGSVDALGLAPGKEACALIKASLVLVLAGDGTAKTSARNTLRGTVTACKEGAVNGEVTIGLKGGRAVTATITNGSIRSLGLQVGVPAAALVKASSVIVAVRD